VRPAVWRGPRARWRRADAEFAASLDDMIYSRAAVLHYLMLPVAIDLSPLDHHSKKMMNIRSDHVEFGLSCKNIIDSEFIFLHSPEFIWNLPNFQLSTL
jgi:hypothetical protein